MFYSNLSTCLPQSQWHILLISVSFFKLLEQRRLCRLHLYLRIIYSFDLVLYFLSWLYRSRHPERFPHWFQDDRLWNVCSNFVSKLWIAGWRVHVLPLNEVDLHFFFFLFSIVLNLFLFNFPVHFLALD